MSQEYDLNSLCKRFAADAATLEIIEKSGGQEDDLNLCYALAVMCEEIKQLKEKGSSECKSF